MNIRGGTVKEEISTYPVGAEVTVHYDPENPSDALLETEGSYLVLVPVFITILFGAIAYGLPRLFSRV